MKHLKMLAVALAATAAMIAVLGTPTASATVLCKTTTTPCGEFLPVGTEVNLGLTSSLTISETGGKVLTTCGQNPVKTKNANTGNGAQTVILTIEQLTFGECTIKPLLLLRGRFEIHHITGTDNGTLTATATEFTIVLGSSDCVYTAGESTDFGTLVGGNPAKVEAHAVFNRKEGGLLCPSDVVWDAKYGVFSWFMPIYVEPQ
jgi:hypothetical protein